MPLLSRRARGSEIFVGISADTSCKEVDGGRDHLNQAVQLQRRAGISEGKSFFQEGDAMRFLFNVYTISNSQYYHALDAIF